MHYIIYGFTGSGKSSYLKNLPHNGSLKLDLDQYILKKHSSYSHLAELISDKGQKWFREAEESYLTSILSEKSDLYLALGGGTLTDSAIELLRKWNLRGIYLKTSFESCWQRIKDDNTRYIVRHGKDNCAQLYEDRLKLFKKFEGVLSENTVIDNELK